MIEENPKGVKGVDLIVGIPSYNEANSIAFPTQVANDGLIEHFGDKNSVIINCDNNSPDGTREAFLNTATEVPKIYLSTPKGVTGKGNNLRNLFQKSRDLGAKAIVVVDADLKSITPRWIKNLGEPLFQDFGFVAPLYVRHKFDGTITNNIAYPMTRSVYGRRVRQPIGGDFGFSGEIASIYLSQDGWTPAVSEFGIDIWMTTIAMCHGIPICQSYMGRPKIHKPKDPGESLGPMFVQVVGTIFDIMARRFDFWKDIRWSKPTAIFGFGLGEMEMPPPVEVDVQNLYEKFQQGFSQSRSLLKGILSANVYKKLSEVSSLSLPRFEFPATLWAEILLEFAVAYNTRTKDGEKTLESLIPLYFGRTCSFVVQLEPMTIQQAEEVIEDQCVLFERSKTYLLKRWPDTK